MLQSEPEEWVEAVGHWCLGRVFVYEGIATAADAEFDTALLMFERLQTVRYQGMVWAARSFRALLTGFYTRALAAARHARSMADVWSYERDIVRAEWLLGAACLESATDEHLAASVSLSPGNQTGKANRSSLLQEAEDHLSEALRRSRAITLRDHEIDALLWLSKWRYVSGESATAEKLALESLDLASSPWRNLIFLSGDSEEDEGRDGATERAVAEK